MLLAFLLQPENFRRALLNMQLMIELDSQLVCRIKSNRLVVKFIE